MQRVKQKCAHENQKKNTSSSHIHTRRSNSNLPARCAPSCRRCYDNSFWLGSLHYVCGLWTFLALGDFKLDLIALLQALVSLRGNRAVVNENVRAIRSSDEPVSFRIIEPLYGSFQTFHLH